ncbi:MAG: rhodanese-like domain-containing protein [Desulfobacterales bacterium]|nr:rhodanese-like domain-containing protein [Desulfobacterales bacterium]
MKDMKRALIAAAAMLITVGILWYANRSVASREASWDDVLTESRRGGYRLINTDELWKRYELNPESLLLVDTRQEWEYRTGHIKTAINFPMESTWLSRWRNKSALETVLGPDKDRRIVFY